MLSLLLLAASCSEPQLYVRKAVKIMDKQGLFAEGESWVAMKDSVSSLKPKTMEEAYDIVKVALKMAGGKHSFLYPADRVKEDAVSEWEVPTISIDGNRIATIKLPKFGGNHNEGVKYANAVLDAVPDDIKGVIIDLRGNTGGNMYPMIASVHRFIADGDNMLRFRTRKRTSWMLLSYVCSGAGISMKSHINCPVAILTDNMTASSGEATLLCFRGLSNCRTFGSPTAGYASSNMPYPMPDGSSLVLTTGCDVARTNEVFCDDPIIPDVLTVTPQEDALDWIMEK